MLRISHFFEKIKGLFASAVLLLAVPVNYAHMSETNAGRGAGYEQARREVEVSEPYKTRFELEGANVELQTHRISSLENPPETRPGLMETGKAEDIMRLYKDRKDMIHTLFGGDLTKIPYTALHSDSKGHFGDFSGPDGQDAFADAEAFVEDGENSSPDWAKDLHRFAELKLARQFAFDEELTAMRGLERRGDKMRLTVGMSKYSEAFFSMGSEGVRFQVTPEDIERLTQQGVGAEHIAELRELHDKLSGHYGEVSIREAIIKQTGGLPDYNQRAHNYLLGVAGTVLTRDGNVAFVNRGAGVSVNRGINVTASGGVKFKKEYLEKYGLQQHLGRQMGDETREEIGLQSGELLLGAMQERIRLELGLGEPDYDLITVGAARELPRGGSPEFMFLIKYKGDTSDLVGSIAGNTHEDRSEIDSLVYTYPMEEVGRLIRQPDAEAVVQHKGILNLMMIERYLNS